MATTYGSTLSIRCPREARWLVIRPEASSRERVGSDYRTGACNRPLDGWVLAISIRAGKRGEANAVQEISTGR